MPDTPIIDTHVHVGIAKYRPIDEYVEVMRSVGAATAVLVQYLGNTNNDYLFDSSSQLRDSATIAIAGDLSHARELLSGGSRGLRFRLDDLHSYMADSSMWELLEQYSAVASLIGNFTEFVSTDLLKLYKDWPRVTFRIEHLGSFHFGSDASEEAVFDEFLNLSNLPNVVTMWSGFYLNCDDDYPYARASSYLQQSLEAFGSDRIMWSGDWNRPSFQSNDYVMAVEHIRSLSFLNAQDKSLILGGTAARIFNIECAD